MEPQKKPIHLNENDTPYLYEPFRNQMPAKRPHPAEKEKILKPWQGLLVFAFLMVLFNLAGIPLVLAGGMYGNALDEIIVFLIGSIPVSYTHLDLRIGSKKLRKQRSGGIGDEKHQGRKSGTECDDGFLCLKNTPGISSSIIVCED